MAELYFFGVPKGFQMFPLTERKYFIYFQQFYSETRNTDEYKLLIRQSKDTVRYIYLRYNIISGDKRTGSLFGIALTLKEQYIQDVQTLLRFFRSIFNGFIDSGQILTVENNVIRYTTQAFNEVEGLFASASVNILEQFNLHFAGTLAPITDQLKKNENALEQSFGVNATNEEIQKAFLEFGNITIAPSIVAPAVPKQNNDEITLEKSEELSTLESRTEKAIRVLERQFELLKVVKRNMKKPDAKNNQITLRKECEDISIKFAGIRDEIIDIERMVAKSKMTSSTKDLKLQITELKDSFADDNKLLADLKEQLFSDSEYMPYEVDRNKVRGQKVGIKKNKTILLYGSIILFIGLIMILLYYKPEPPGISTQVVQQAKDSQAIASHTPSLRNLNLASPEEVTTYAQAVAIGDSLFNMKGTKNLRDALKYYERAKLLSSNDKNILHKIRDVNELLNNGKKKPGGGPGKEIQEKKRENGYLKNPK